jgi:RimJ/RimL family protein N-acetyltransferase
MSGSPPHFAASLRRLVLRFPTQEPCVLQALDENVTWTPQDETAIAIICNEPLIYHRLFHKRLGGQPYSLAKAQGFLRWAKQGWRDRSWFVFLLRDSNDQVVGAIDIKSTHTEGAEIGYWASATSPGVMTNAVFELCDVAREAGYRQLFALIAPDNVQSLGVVSRAGFVQTEDLTRDGTRYRQFARSLV